MKMFQKVYHFGVKSKKPERGQIVDIQTRDNKIYLVTILLKSGATITDYENTFSSRYPAIYNAFF